MTMVSALQRALGGVDASQSVAMNLCVNVTSEAFSAATTRTQALPGGQHSVFSSLLPRTVSGLCKPLLPCGSVLWQQGDGDPPEWQR